MFHVRIRAVAQQSPFTEAILSAEWLKAARRYHEPGHWWCELLLLMPDHLHALLRFSHETNMSAVMSSWKRGVARFQGVNWQGNFFDHRIRNKGEAAEKWHYIRLSPVVKGLCASEDDWRTGGVVERTDRSAFSARQARWGQRAPPQCSD